MIDDAMIEKFKDVDNRDILQLLRSRGLVVCAFTADDVISVQIPEFIENPSGELISKAYQWLADHEERIEDAMTEAGNFIIGFAPDPIFPPLDDEEDEDEA